MLMTFCPKSDETQGRRFLTRHLTQLITWTCPALFSKLCGSVGVPRFCQLSDVLVYRLVCEPAAKLRNILIARSNAQGKGKDGKQKGEAMEEDGKVNAAHGIKIITTIFTFV